MSTPNFYQLHGHHLNVTYSTSGLGGKPSFEYQDAQQTLSFQGDAIHTVEAEMGTLVSVTIHKTIDTGSTSFTLLVPRVNLTGPNQQVHITTEGITTIHRFSVLQVRGQTQLYRATQLTGIAETVVF